VGAPALAADNAAKPATLSSGLHLGHPQDNGLTLRPNLAGLADFHESARREFLLGSDQMIRRAAVYCLQS
jgi:hypothetical protein